MNLDSQIEKSFRLKQSQKKALERLGIITLRDLLFHFPSRYDNLAQIKNIAELNEGDDAIIYGKIISIKTGRAYRKKIPLTESVVEDSTGKIKVVWFHQAYIAKMHPVGSFVKLKGKITERNKAVYLANPEIEKREEIPIDISDSLFRKKKDEYFFYPIYRESRGVTSRWFYHSIHKILKSDALDSLKDPIPEEILKKYSLPKLKTALIWIHSPKKKSDEEAARKRFAFEEIFFIQLSRQIARREYKKNSSFNIDDKS